MVIDLVECLGQIYDTKIRCTATFGKALYNITDSTNSKVASKSLFKPELIVCCIEERSKAV